MVNLEQWVKLEGIAESRAFLIAWGILNALKTVMPSPCRKETAILARLYIRAA
jgi:hypothetical protein